MDGVVSLRMIYHGQEKVSARFVFEICRNREEFRNEIETFLKQETERYCFCPIIKSLDIPNFLSHEILFDPKYKLLPFNTLYLRVKVFYNVDDTSEQPPDINRTPLNHNTFITLVFNNEEIPNIPVLPLRKMFKTFR
uniref:Uncharacterized protein n=1 Tax=Panagrolaimus superbus TaxID=310955 RepID=A0A914YNA7_9BILA